MGHYCDYARRYRNEMKRLAHLLAANLGPHRLSSNSPKLWILMYHRVLPSNDPRYADEEPGMVVTPETFRSHLRELKGIFEPLPLAEWLRRRKENRPLPPRACAVTFDDGWLDNYEFALPAIEAEQFPTTLFAVASMIGTTREFWPNRLQRLMNNMDFSSARASSQWLVDLIPSGDLDERERRAHLIHACKQLPDQVLHERLSELESELQLDETRPPALMNWDQLHAMVRSGYVEVGSHTCNHYRLVDALDRETMAREITESKRLLEDRLNCSVDLFCYPNGDASEAAVRIVKSEYLAAVTTRKGINTVRTNDHHLLRIGVHEDVSDNPVKFKARLSGWI